MYGLVNMAVEDLVRTRFGDDAWERIRTRAGVEIPAFVSNQGYDDAVTYSLVGAASEVLELGPETILEEFGKHWVLETARKGYGEMLAAAGSTLPQFLDNLPGFHTRVVLILPDLQPPEFRISERTDTSLVLHYHSHRDGLQPFVRGLVLGLGEHLETSVSIELRTGRHEGLDHDEFLIRWGPDGA